jgi:hypothetical protein
MSMTPTLRRSVAALGVAGAVLATVGCGSRSSPSGATKTTLSVPNPAKAGADAAGAKLFGDWPTPAGALLISGEQIGYLEPCGCTAGQRGGLARRLDLVERLKAQGWKLAAIDLGSLINDPNTMGGPEETRIRYTFALKALETIGYDAVALSPVDLKLGVGEVMTRYLNHQGERLKVVSANVTPDPSLGLADRVVPAVRTAAGPITIGVTAVIDPDAFARLGDPEKGVMLTCKAPEEVLPDLVADLERDTQVQVLMVQGPPEVARRLAEKFPNFEVVVATSAFVEPPRDSETLNGGKTQLISVGKKGQFVGVLGLYQDETQPFRYHRLELNARLNNKTEAMRKLVDEDFQEELKVADVLGTYPRRAYVHGDSPTDATFVGAQTCRGCHPNTYAHWAQSKHAHAYEALTMDPKRNRTFDAQCVSCHTVGFEYEGGFVRAEEQEHLKGVQCENCHGPGSKHAANPVDAAIRAAMHRDAADFDKNGRCIKCHTEDDSPHFDFATYWPKVAHKGLDKIGLPPAAPAKTAAGGARAGVAPR